MGAHRSMTSSTNPELSWEYWNGTGWWKLVVTRDETLNLKMSGKLEFKVPPDLAATDWSGRTNYWIRARLVGGDYGREKVSVAISPRDPMTARHAPDHRALDGGHPCAIGRKLRISLRDLRERAADVRVHAGQRLVARSERRESHRRGEG